jgi:transcription termination factor Rho
MQKNTPQDILELAYTQYTKGKYSQSLENYEWFFDNAVQIDTTYIGAKYRSLKEWYSLAKEYKPAYTALINKKNTLLKSFNKSKNEFLLIDYAKICHVLNDDEEFIELFKKLEKQYPEITKDIYISIENILIKNEEWKICNDYIKDSMGKYKTLLNKFDELIRISEGAYNGEYNQNYQKEFEVDIQNLFKILSVGNRQKEIDAIISKLKNDLTSRGGSIDYTI